MITKKQIEKAKQEALLKDDALVNDNRVRIAYQWLDAQNKIKNPTKASRDLKGLIKKWAGEYISKSDVEVAAQLHPNISGIYPFYNISSRLTEPAIERIQDIADLTQRRRDSHNPSDYSIKEIA